MAVSRLRRFACRDSVRYFPIVGDGGAVALESLAPQAGFRRATTPRHATVLVLAGSLPERTHAAIARLHDQMPHPRLAVRLGVEHPPASPAAISVAGDVEAPHRILELAREVLRGERESSPAALPDEPPAPWRGLGDHGQGGEGMMGGKPYGRPMAMPGDDLRDGLALDRLPLEVGPFFPGLPPGLVLRVVLQGDVVQEIEVEEPPLDDAVPPVFRRSLQETVPVGELERARARQHLRHLAVLLRVCGLEALAERAESVAAAPSVRALARLRALSRGAVARFALAGGSGSLTRRAAAAWGGPTALAAGNDEDLRGDDPIYRALGFRLLVRHDGDLRARWLQRFDEAEQALELAAKADERSVTVGPLAAVEAPEGPHGASAAETPDLDRIGGGIVGLEWGEALRVLASLTATGIRMRRTEAAA